MVGGVALGMTLFSAAFSHAQQAVPNPEQDAAAVNPETSKPDAILFRIENIKPIANEEGLTTKCSFIVTVYNRTQKEVEEADIDFFWKDDISAKYRVESDSVVAVGKEEATTIVQKNMILEKKMINKNY